MKKLLAFILVSVMLLALAACTLPDLGDDGDNSDEKKDEEDGLPVIEGDKYTAKHMRSYFPEYDAFDEQVIEFIKGKDLCELSLIDHEVRSSPDSYAIMTTTQKIIGTVSEEDGKLVFSITESYLKIEFAGPAADMALSSYKEHTTQSISEAEDEVEKEAYNTSLKACDGKYVKLSNTLIDLISSGQKYSLKIEGDKLSSFIMTYPSFSSTTYDFTYHENGNIASSNMTDSDSDSEEEATTYHENGNIASIYQWGDLFTFDQDGKFIPIDEK